MRERNCQPRTLQTVKVSYNEELIRHPQINCSCGNLLPPGVWFQKGGPQVECQDTARNSDLQNTKDLL
jgi:hypothetical protein